MKDRDLTIYMSIETPSADVHMFCLYNPIVNKHYPAHLAFNNHLVHGNACWDSDGFIFDTYYPFLKRWQERMLTIGDRNEFENDLQCSEEQMLDIIDVIEQAIDLGWNKIKNV